LEWHSLVKSLFVYSITPFLIYRPFETLRTYIHNEDIPVRLVAAGRGEDYEIDGISHQSNDVRKILDCLPDIEQHFPMDKKEIPNLVSKMVKVNTAQFISLRRLKLFAFLVIRFHQHVFGRVLIKKYLNFP